jgi:hypothetical protein
VGQEVAVDEAHGHRVDHKPTTIVELQDDELEEIASPPEQLDAAIVADHLADTSRDNGVGGFQFGCAEEVHP